MVMWHDLLSIPWKLHGTDRSGMDCSTLAEEVLRRTGATPPESSPYRAANRAGEEGEIESFLSSLEAGFDRIGSVVSDATKTGDLVLACDEHGMARHLYVLVEPSRGTFLTATHTQGVRSMRRGQIATMNRFMTHSISGVYRIAGGCPC